MFKMQMIFAVAWGGMQLCPVSAFVVEWCRKGLEEDEQLTVEASLSLFSSNLHNDGYSCFLNVSHCNDLGWC